MTHETSDNTNIVPGGIDVSPLSDLYIHFCRQVLTRSLRTAALFLPGSHTFFLLCTSSGKVRLGRQQYNIEPDTILYAPARSAGSVIFRCPADTYVTVLSFSGTMAEEYLARAGFHMSSAARLKDSLGEVRDLITRLTDIRYVTEANELMRTALLYQLFSVLTACNMQRSQKGSRAGEANDVDYLYFFLDYIRSHVDTVTIQALARAGGLSRTYVYRLFRKRYGMSPSDFILRYRMTLAAHKIQTTPESLKDIAAETGYQTYAGFSTAFQKYFHVLPTAAHRQQDIL